jgi:hypothetical protein
MTLTLVLVLFVMTVSTPGISATMAFVAHAIRALVTDATIRAFLILSIITDTVAVSEINMEMTAIIIAIAIAIAITPIVVIAAAAEAVAAIRLSFVLFL